MQFYKHFKLYVNQSHLYMPNKLVRTLYVGVGGTGFKTIIQTKRYFAETYGKDKIPPVVAFLAIDTDGGEPNADPVVRLEPDEIVSISVQKPKTYYNNNQDAFGWLPDENLSAMSRLNNSFSPIRTNGRFAITINYQKVKNRISDALSKIMSATFKSEDGSWELESDVDIKVHLVFSLCGGTGCGTFLNLAYIIRTAVPGCTLKAYAVLPDVLQVTGRMLAVAGANAYGALYDLDYFMTMLDGKSGGLPYELQMYESRILNQRPFDSVYLIDNKNKNGDSYSKLDQIQKMIGLVLYTSTGYDCACLFGVHEHNFNMSIDSLAVKGKRAWVSGLGLCELIVKPSSLKMLYSFKAASQLVDKMLSVKMSYHNIENHIHIWIDSHSIRENENNDRLLDSILNLETLMPYKNKVSTDVIWKVLADWVNNQVPDSKKLNEVKEMRLSDLISDLNEKVDEILCEEGGLQHAYDFLIGLFNEIKMYRYEITEESRLLEDERKSVESYKDKIVNSMLGRRFFRRASSFYEDIELSVNRLVKMTADILRHKTAVSFYTDLLGWITKKLEALKEIKLMLASAKKRLRDKISEIESEHVKCPFRIDLTSRFFPDVNPSEDPDICIRAYLESLDSPGDLFSFVKQNADNIFHSLISFGESLDANKKYDEINVESVLNRIKNENVDEFYEIIKTALKKSQVLLDIDDREKSPEDKNASPYNYLLIAVGDGPASILRENEVRDLIDTEIDGCNLVNCPDKRRVIFMRQRGVMPAYQVTGVMKYEPEYTELSETMNFHIDETLYRLMQQKKFKLEPSN